MNAKELRDRMIEKRTLYQNALKESNQARQEIEEILKGFDNEMVELLLLNGFSLDQIIHVDLGKLQKDPAALEEYIKAVDGVIGELQSFLEEELK